MRGKPAKSKVLSSRERAWACEAEESVAVALLQDASPMLPEREGKQRRDVLEADVDVVHRARCLPTESREQSGGGAGAGCPPQCGAP